MIIDKTLIVQRLFTANGQGLDDECITFCLKNIFRFFWSNQNIGRYNSPAVFAENLSIRRDIYTVKTGFVRTKAETCRDCVRSGSDKPKLLSFSVGFFPGRRVVGFHVFCNFTTAVNKRGRPRDRFVLAGPAPLISTVAVFWCARPIFPHRTFTPAITGGSRL